MYYNVLSRNFKLLIQFAGSVWCQINDLVAECQKNKNWITRWGKKEV